MQYTFLLPLIVSIPLPFFTVFFPLFLSLFFPLFFPPLFPLFFRSIQYGQGNPFDTMYVGDFSQIFPPKPFDCSEGLAAFRFFLNTEDAHVASYIIGHSMEVRGGLHGASWSSVEVSMKLHGGLHGASMEAHGSPWSSTSLHGAP